MNEKHKGAFIAGSALLVILLLLYAKNRAAGGSGSSGTITNSPFQTTPGVLVPNMAFAQQPP
ncbi:MAG: hypothetical protein ACYC0J_10345, partial [Gammaproteobacteria bacterium]